MVLTPSQAMAFYDRFGAKQDSQSFYEDAALEELMAHAAFEQASGVFELGCGTGRFAANLLAKQLPFSASYVGSDISRTMIELAKQRIASFGERARVTLADGAMAFPLPDHSVDRVVSTYVLDLLSETDIQQAIEEAGRVLTPNGKLCLASLTQGNSVASHVVTGLWSAAFHLHAPLVGGCRPIQLESYVRPPRWTVEYCNVITQFGVPSEVLIARPAEIFDNPHSATATHRRSH